MTESGQRLLDRLRRDHDRGFMSSDEDQDRDAILAIEAEKRAETLQSVLRGLRSERDTVQLRAIIASVEWMLENPSGATRND